MQGQANYEDVKESGGFNLLPDGHYIFQIVETKEGYTSTASDPMINIKCQCIEDEFSTNIVWDNIILPKPGSPAEGIKGRTKRFLHAINEPYQGNFVWDSDRWLNKKVQAVIGQKDGNKGPMNFVKGYEINDSLNPKPNYPNNSANKQSNQTQMPWENQSQSEEPELPF